MNVAGELQVQLVKMRQAEMREEVARDRLARMARRGREGRRARPSRTGGRWRLGATIWAAVAETWRCGGAMLPRGGRPDG